MSVWISRAWAGLTDLKMSLTLSVINFCHHAGMRLALTGLLPRNLGMDDIHVFGVVERWGYVILTYVMPAPIAAVSCRS